MAKNNKSFLGTGWSFPPTFEKKMKHVGVEMVSDEEDIKQSLEIILSTNVGERTMLPRFGCNLQDYLFKEISTTRLNFLKDLVRTAIINYEPRIKLLEVHLDQTQYLEGVIHVLVKYEIRKTNNRFNLVFPYYKIEATGIPMLMQNKVIQNPEK